MKEIIALLKSLFSTGNVIEKVKTIKELDKEVKKIVPVKKTPIKQKKK